ncbi:2819_t:CDS:2 [Ambispora leptoticha]|uniref:2819_t:CDS:1 n=1 Tax=Ambispora leptoticha TaxID=144679 RepID=A0A9N8W813_9GLOM|nr:2819_t:CDS:2 [Ambispora leptoticha]
MGTHCNEISRGFAFAPFDLTYRYRGLEPIVVDLPISQLRLLLQKQQNCYEKCSALTQLLSLFTSLKNSWKNDKVIETELYNWMTTNRFEPEMIFRIVYNERNHVKFASLLAFFYMRGIGTNVNAEEAFHFSYFAASKGDLIGQNDVACCYQFGTGTIKNERKAFYWFRKCAKEGNVAGIFNLGSCYYHGIGTTERHDKAFDCFLKAAEAGFGAAQGCVGFCYRHGKGTKPDLKTALYWYEQASNSGNAQAQLKLAYCYQQGIGLKKRRRICRKTIYKVGEKYGLGIKKNDVTGFYWHLQSAKCGNARGQNNVARSYKSGQGTVRDVHEAIRYYRQAISQGGNSHVYSELKSLLLNEWW